MSRLTPNKPITDAEFQSALEVIANHTMKLKQAEQLTRAITIDDSESIWAPDIDDIADQFCKANQAHQAGQDPDRYELPYMGNTLSQLEALGTKWSAA